MKFSVLPFILLAALGPATGAPQAHAAADAAAARELPGQSLYHLQAGFSDQHGNALRWDALRGRPQLVSMIYANCHLMCPLIIENAKAVQKRLPAAQRARLDVAMVSLDPARDTPQVLAEVAQRHRVGEHWRFLQPRPEDVRALASVLDVRYRFREDGSINHTSVLVLLDAEGRVVARSEVVGAAPDPAFLEDVREALAGD
ncbi:SCO family protein [Pseudoxanthomonas broegbernensis]|uniref:SCO family protein n=1 Tax=Pseudoxanthomonas broegbernensis TaxID=83619 RepID=A0A7V8GKC3_9GAMM|nr:SCO family protein [Pseudoxanthomonas broegbernensis]KAF1684918.1 SCO family protein [Pseudoxanthomonas broegbernensis]MBB6066288.1 protein SCO1/2 [Pseudoxanthomonas broegbernensis]